MPEEPPLKYDGAEIVLNQLDQLLPPDNLSFIADRLDVCRSFRKVHEQFILAREYPKINTEAVMSGAAIAIETYLESRGCFPGQTQAHVFPIPEGFMPEDTTDAVLRTRRNRVLRAHPELFALYSQIVHTKTNSVLGREANTLAGLIFGNAIWMINESYGTSPRFNE